MSDIVDELLIILGDEELLEQSALPWVKGLVEATNKALEDHGVENYHVCTATTGKALKIALKQLPTPVRIVLLNDFVVSFGKRQRRDTDKLKREEHNQTMRERRLRYDMMKYGAIIITFLIVVFIIATIIISWKMKVSPSSELATGLFNTLIQIFKLMFGVL